MHSKAGLAGLVEGEDPSVLCTVLYRYRIVCTLASIVEQGPFQLRPPGQPEGGADEQGTSAVLSTGHWLRAQRHPV